MYVHTHVMQSSSNELSIPEPDSVNVNKGKLIHVLKFLML